MDQTVPLQAVALPVAFFLPDFLEVDGFMSEYTCPFCGGTAYRACDDCGGPVCADCDKGQGPFVFCPNCAWVEESDADTGAAA